MIKTRKVHHSIQMAWRRMNQLTAEWTASMTIRDSSKWNSMLHIYLEWNSICWFTSHSNSKYLYSYKQPKPCDDDCIQCKTFSDRIKSTQPISIDQLCLSLSRLLRAFFYTHKAPIFIHAKSHSDTRSYAERTQHIEVGRKREKQVIKRANLTSC